MFFINTLELIHSVGASQEIIHIVQKQEPFLSLFMHQLFQALDF